MTAAVGVEPAPARAALVIVDVQCGLFDVEPAPADADAVIERINQLSRQARQAELPVIVVQHEQAEGALVHGSDGWQLQPQLQLADGDHRLRKTTPDSFLRTGLDEVLSLLGVEELVICGYASEFCIDSTSRSAAAHGYAVTVVADGHTTCDKPHASAAQIRQHHNATLSNITSFGARIRALPAADIRFD
ncbi:cysteine hydrolase family protein [Pseudoxanthomonas dokdonensis]|uniref:Isochorismatase n=1 Tax=Pseudoxanthomonas dokdonensis TaxID=344882 RepID=A0A0R0CJB2_9GAMM|nr:cysteine hydrolase family protein [Pseudoxanthomonas dokdonensis]KRG70009.1 isochorismatase [Pseudoxanthomonas dokdonensis]